MAHFRATIQGNRGQASRLGTKKTGLLVTLNGWKVIYIRKAGALGLIISDGRTAQGKWHIIDMVFGDIAQAVNDLRRQGYAVNVGLSAEIQHNPTGKDEINLYVTGGSGSGQAKYISEVLRNKEKQVERLTIKET